MGTGPADKLREIEQLRAQLDAKVAELENRLPPIAALGQRAVAAALGGGVSGSMLWMLVKRRRAKKRSKAKTSAPAPTVVVNALPRSVVPIAVGAVAVWAAVRVYELKQRSADDRRTTRPAVVTPMPEQRQAL